MIDYLEGDFCAHCSPVGDDGLVVGVFAVPAVELDAAASGKENLKGKSWRLENTKGSTVIS